MLAHLIGAFLADLQADDASPTTLRRHRRLLTGWERWLVANDQPQHPQAWTPALIATYLATLDGEAKRRHERSLWHFRQWLEVEGYAAPQHTGSWQNW